MTTALLPVPLALIVPLLVRTPYVLGLTPTLPAPVTVTVPLFTMSSPWVPDSTTAPAVLLDSAALLVIGL